MSQAVRGIFYDGITSRPWDAFVSVREPNALEVEVPGFEAGTQGDRFLWPLEHKGMQWERTSTTLRLSFGEHPRKVLIVRDPVFIKSFALRMRFSGRQGVYDHMLTIARSGPVLFTLAVIALVVGGYFWALPWTAERLVLLLPESLDRELGEAVYAQMAPTLTEDSTRTKALQAFGDHLQLSEDFDLRYHVVDDPTVNAFALPGGDIVVFTGILDKMDEPGELAALLAHEGTHVDARHSTRALVRNLAGHLFLSLILGDVNAVVAVVAENANEMRNMSYSRSLESDADARGQERMHANGVDPIGMVHLLKLLEEEAADMPEALEFLSSHPLTEERIAKAEARAKELGRAQGSEELQTLFDAVEQRTTPAVE